MPGDSLDMQYFTALKTKINKKLIEIEEELNEDERTIVEAQIKEYPWVYGALGKVPSDVMLIAENPSITGIEHAGVDAIDGNPPDIEAQWWGGKNDNAAVIFRPVLFDLGLKTSPPHEKGGWNCYITNVIKRANNAGDHEEIAAVFQHQQEDEWSEILYWEIENVKPKILFCLGRKTETAIRRLIREGSIQDIPFHYVLHYAARGMHESIRKTMKSQIREAMRNSHLADN